MADPSLDPLDWALRALRDHRRQRAYATAYRYYDGEHPMMFATEKFRTVFGKTLREVADNLCPAVVDSVSDRLRVTGIAPVEGEGTADLANHAWKIWQRNRMDVRAPETHHEALLAGDGYALVWPNRAGDQAVIWSIPACEMAVSYDPNEPGWIRRAARLWHDEDDGVAHLDLYLPEVVRRYATTYERNAAGQFTSSKDTFGRMLGALKSEERTSVEEVRNEWGRVPVVHFPNRRYHCYGVSELKDVIPLQDALNKTVCDLLVNNEFAAFRQRWATGYGDADGDSADTAEPGIDTRPPLDYGNDRMITSSDPETRFGNFDASEAQGFLETMENFRSEIARVSGTPLHYLFITRGDFPSGEAMKSAEARFTRKVEQRQTSFGNQWEDLLALACRMEGAEKADGAMLSLEWESAEPTGLHENPAAGPTPNERADQLERRPGAGAVDTAPPAA